MAKKTDVKDWSLADKRYGWQFGCDGTVNSTEAARLIGKSQPWVSAILNGNSRKTPGGRGYPIRAGKSKDSDRNWEVCLRSINEYLAARQPIEV
jgi:hypothetical protein